VIARVPQRPTELPEAAKPLFDERWFADTLIGRRAEPGTRHQTVLPIHPV
jgi:hypothetical protein